MNYHTTEIRVTHINSCTTALCTVQCCAVQFYSDLFHWLSTKTHLVEKCLHGLLNLVHFYFIFTVPFFQVCNICYEVRSCYVKKNIGLSIMTYGNKSLKVKTNYICLQAIKSLKKSKFEDYLVICTLCSLRRTHCANAPLAGSA